MLQHAAFFSFSFSAVTSVEVKPVCFSSLQFRNQYDNDVTVWSPQVSSTAPGSLCQGRGWQVYDHSIKGGVHPCAHHHICSNARLLLMFRWLLLKHLCELWGFNVVFTLCGVYTALSLCCMVFIPYICVMFILCGIYTVWCLSCAVFTSCGVCIVWRLHCGLCGVYTVWFLLSQGRIHQIEYAMEAVKQGSATVGLKSRTHAVLVALKVFVTVQILSTTTHTHTFHHCHTHTHKPFGWSTPGRAPDRWECTLFSSLYCS